MVTRSPSCTGVLIRPRTDPPTLATMTLRFRIYLAGPRTCARTASTRPLRCLRQGIEKEGTKALSNPHRGEGRGRKIIYLHKPNSEKGNFLGNTKWQYFILKEKIQLFSGENR